MSTRRWNPRRTLPFPTPLYERGNDCRGGTVINHGSGLAFSYTPCTDELDNNTAEWKTVHELGHMRLNITDFYAVSTGTPTMIIPSNKATNDPSTLFTLYDGCGHSVMGGWGRWFCTPYNHLYNQRWVRGNNNETLAYASDTNTVYNEYEDGIVNFNGGYTITTTRPFRSTFWNAKSPNSLYSDYTIQYDAGRWLWVPDGSADSYLFQEFSGRPSPLAGFPGLVTSF